MLRIFLSVFIFLFASLTWALEPPKGHPILVISGNVLVLNSEVHATFDREMLEALDWREVESYTEFSDGLQSFAGPTLASVLDAIGVSEGTLHARALDDYIIQIPVTDAEAFGVILALDRNGKPMRVRDKGPLWVIYPASDPSELNELHSSRMIWQLKSIEVGP